MKNFALNIAFGILHLVYPGLNKKQLVEGPIAERAFGKLPPWSTLAHHQVVDTQKADVGACVMCLYLDGPHNDVMIVLGERPDPKNPDNGLYNGSGGGFGVLTDREQPADMAAREWSEENRKLDDKPLFLLKPDKMRQIDIGEGVDYRNFNKGRGAPVAYVMHYIWLDDAQKMVVKRHAENMADETYRQTCMKHTRDETKRVQVMKLEDAAGLAMESFAHPHELKAVRKLLAIHKAGQLLQP